MKAGAALAVLLLLLPAALAQQAPELSPYLPGLQPWKLVKGDEGSAMLGSNVPRVPEELYRVYVSANLHGSLATPLVDEKEVFLTDGIAVYALNAENGKEEWEADVYDNFKGRFVETYALNEHLYVATSRTPGGGGRSFLLALSKSTGRVVWKKEVGDKPTSNMIIADGRLCFGTVYTEGLVRCFTLSGEPVWSTKVGGNVRGLAAYGDVLYVSTEGGEPSKKLYALNLSDGRILWSYKHNSIVKSPAVKNGRIFFVDSTGSVVSLSEDGKLAWAKKLGAGSDVNGHSLLAVGDRELYVARTLGEKPLNLFVLDFSGKVIGNFTLDKEEEPGRPVAAGDIVLLPVRGRDYGRVYFLWRGTTLLHQVTYRGEEVFTPRVSSAGGAVFAIFSVDRKRQMLVILGDKKVPAIENVTVAGKVRSNEGVKIRAVIGDRESAIYRALLFYRVNGSRWRAVEMLPERRYVVEPAGGYGLKPEPFAALIPPQPAGSVVEYMVAAIDSVGNHALSQSLSYLVTEPEEEKERAPVRVSAAKEERGVCGPTSTALIALLALALLRRQNSR